MSQYVVETNDGDHGNDFIMYGWDGMLGYWVDFYRGEDPDIPYREESTFQTGVTNGKMLDILDGVGVLSKIPEAHISSITLDLPF